MLSSGTKKKAFLSYHKELIYKESLLSLQQGDTLETGHYTAACKNPYDNQWYKFDDQRVNVVPADQVPDEIVNNEAYILFYQRRKTDSAECSSNSSSSDHWLSKIAIPPVNSSKSMATISSSIDSSKEMIATKSNDTLKNIEIESTAVTQSNKEIQTDDSILLNKANDEIAIIDTTAIKVKQTNEDEIIDVENIENGDLLCNDNDIQKQIASTNSIQNEIKPSINTDAEHEHIKEILLTPTAVASTTTKSIAIDSSENDIDIEVELRNVGGKKAETALSVSFPTQRSLWPFDNHNTIHTYTPILSRGSLNFSDMLSSNLHCERNAQLRHSLSTSLGQRNSNSSSQDKSKLISANERICSMRSLIKQQSNVNNNLHLKFIFFLRSSLFDY